MNIDTKKQIAALVTSLFLVACGSEADKTSESNNQTSVELEAANTEKNETIVVDAAFEVPEPYKSYLRQELSETVENGEYQTISDEIFNNYKTNWLKQAASVQSPNWEVIAEVMHPEIEKITNEFKRQELVEATKSEIKKDEKSLNTYFAVTGEFISGLNVDAKTGEYKLSLKPGARISIPNPGFYEIDYPNEKTEMFTPDNPRYLDMTIKVPIEKAKQIESLREGIHKSEFEMVRLYGKVVGPSAIKDRNNLSFKVEAFDVGLRKDGSFKSYFFIGPEEVKKGLVVSY